MNIVRTTKTYKAVGCDFMDQIEILASRGKEVELTYLNEIGIAHKTITVLKTWETKEKEEFLITVDGLRLRLDYVLSIDGYTNSQSCSIN